MEERMFLLVRRRMRLNAVSLAVALLFYFLLPLSLIFLPEVMNRPSFLFSLPWAWVYAFFQFPMTWVFVWFFHRKAKQFEHELAEISGEAGQ